MNLNNDQEVIDDEEEDEEEEEGEQKQSANHSSRILVEVPVEVSAIDIRIIFVVAPHLMVHIQVVPLLMLLYRWRLRYPWPVSWLGL